MAFVRLGADVGQRAQRNFRGAADIGLDDDTLQALQGRRHVPKMSVVPQIGSIMAE